MENKQKSFYKIFKIKLFFIFLLIIKIRTYKKPKLSVIVPIYNIEKYYLNKILDLLIVQPLKEVEFILIDDKSTDGTGKYIEKFTKKDNRFLIIHNFKNLGIATSRNIGFNFVFQNFSLLQMMMISLILILIKLLLMKWKKIQVLI